MNVRLAGSVTETVAVADVTHAVILGRIVEPYGLGGWCKVHLFGGDAAELGRMAHWWLASADALQQDAAVPAAAEVAAPWQAYPLLALRPHGKGLIAKFAGIDGRTAAEDIDGCFIAAPRALLPVPAKDEYYWADLIGAEVVNLADQPLGVVAELMSSGAHEVLCVRDAGGGERLLPFVAEVVKSVDITAVPRLIRVDWGLDW